MKFNVSKFLARLIFSFSIISNVHVSTQIFAAEITNDRYKDKLNEIFSDLNEHKQFLLAQLLQPAVILVRNFFKFGITREVENGLGVAEIPYNSKELKKYFIPTLKVVINKYEYFEKCRYINKDFPFKSVMADFDNLQPHLAQFIDYIWDDIKESVESKNNSPIDQLLQLIYDKQKETKPVFSFEFENICQIF